MKQIERLNGMMSTVIGGIEIERYTVFFCFFLF